MCIRLASVAALGLVAGCASTTADSAKQAPNSAVTTAADQKATTPDEALARLLSGNERFVAGKSLQHNYPAQVKATSTGQYPYAIVLACIDSRSAPEIVFDQGLGDLFVPRIAGNYANPDILGSMEFAAAVAGAKLILVLGHTECGAVKGAADDVKLGNLTTVITAIKPAAEDVKDVTGPRTSKNHEYVLELTEANVLRTVTTIRANSPTLADLERQGKIKIVPAMYDISSGKVTVLK
jgi:carbonic anhydrase